MPALESISRDRLNTAALIVFLLICLFCGGASRADAQSQVIVRVAAVLLGAVALASSRLPELARVRIVLILAACLAASIALQLVPLPAGWSLGLPGRHAFAAAAHATGVGGVPRPISLTPDLTLNSLAALFPAVAVLVALAALPAQSARWLVPALLTGIAASAMMGIAQLAAGPFSSLYLYDITNPGAPVGFFANRNHQAVFLALAFPLLRIWIGDDERHRHASRKRLWIGLAFGIFIFILILATGSRAGLALALVGLAGSFVMMRGEAAGSKLAMAGRAKIAIAAAAAAILIAGIGALIWTSRGATLNRLSEFGGGEDLRFSNFSRVIDLTVSYLPFGSGFGSFDAAYRQVEPDVTLTHQYFNHAHNDLIELVLTGGLPALAVLAAFLVWLTVRTARVWRIGSAPLPRRARLGTLMAWMLLIASLADYPLRTPLLSVVLAIAAYLAARPKTPPAPPEVALR